MQVVFYKVDFERQLHDVLSGQIDVGIISSGWLEDHYPEKLNLLRFHASDLNGNIYHRRGIPTLFEAESIPFFTSTDLVALNGLAAAPHISSPLREHVLQALLKLDPATAPAMRTAGVAKFTIPSSYAYPRILAMAAGIMATRETRTHCIGPFARGIDLVICPAGTVPSEALAEDACAEAGLACPDGLPCLCRPCRPLTAANFYPWPVVLGLCCALFVVGIWFGLCWRIPLEHASLIPSMVNKHDLRADSGKGTDRMGKV